MMKGQSALRLIWDVLGDDSEDRRPVSRVYLSSPDVTELEEQYLVDAIRTGWIAPLGLSLSSGSALSSDATGRIGYEIEAFLAGRP